MDNYIVNEPPRVHVATEDQMSELELELELKHAIVPPWIGRGGGAPGGGTRVHQVSVVQSSLIILRIVVGRWIQEKIDKLWNVATCSKMNEF